MAILQLKAGQNPLVYQGPTELLLANQPWYTTANVSLLFAPNASNVGYTSGRPGNSFGLTKLPAPATNRVTGFIVVAKVDFTIESTTLGLGSQSSDSLVLPTIPSGGASTDNVFRLTTSGFTFGAPLITNASTGAPVAGTVTFQLDQGGFTDYPAFNTALAAVPLAEIQSGIHAYTIRCIIPSGVAATVEIPTL